MLQNLSSAAVVIGALRANVKVRITGPEVIKLFSCSTQLSKKSILLIKAKIPTIVGILIFFSRINTASESFNAS